MSLKRSTVPGLRRFVAGLLAAALLTAPLMAQNDETKPRTHHAKGAAAGKKAAGGTKHGKAAGKTAKKAGGAGQDAVPSPKKGRAKKGVAKGSPARRAAEAAKAQRIRQAFQASSELRPMAQQLAGLRTPAAYAGVTSYADHHTGEAAAAAYLALGHAYLLDKRYDMAASSLRRAQKAGDLLDDYVEFLAAQAELAGGNPAGAEALLKGFTERHPESIFAVQAPETEAAALVALGRAADAERVLTAAATGAAASRAGYQLEAGVVAQALGQREQAIGWYKRAMLGHPLAADADQARAKLEALGALDTLTTSEQKQLAEAYQNAGRYTAASDAFHRLAEHAATAQERNSFAVAAAACDLKLKRLTPEEADALGATADENGAHRLYLMMELARGRADESRVAAVVTQLESQFPHSQWLAEALYSTGNMYLLKRDYPSAIRYYLELSDRFPQNKHAAALHWRAAWLNYRMGQREQAARLADEQIQQYPKAPETSAALYWRGRIDEAAGRTSQAAAHYRTLTRIAPHFFYGQLARQRLALLGNAPAANVAGLEKLSASPVPQLSETVPTNSLHMAKARLLANAGLNDYIAEELAADPDSASWGALAEAQIYASYGEHYRALRSLKRALPTAASMPIGAVPLPYWRILFPEPWWTEIKTEAAKNGLDPYLVASLIRQESEFNPGAISHANAYGLMQMLPAVGKQMARADGDGKIETFHLLDPATNIRLGTRYLKQTIDKFGGVTEYALAAYNAGDERVSDWKANGPYEGIDEFVESIPFTETREYVEAILRNEEMYRAIDQYASEHGK